jgi:alpha-amylase
VQEKLSGYLNKLIGYGVAGFRVDAAKYNFPIHIEEIFDRTNHLNTRWFPADTKPYVYNEVREGGGGGRGRKSVGWGK